MAEIDMSDDPRITQLEIMRRKIEAEEALNPKLRPLKKRIFQLAEQLTERHDQPELRDKLLSEQTELVLELAKITPHTG